MKATTLLTALFLSSPTLAGPGSSGGGGAFVCRDPQTRQPVSAELIDLWEAHTVRGRTIAYDDVTPVDAQVAAALERLKLFDTALAAKTAEDVAYVQSHFEDLPSNIALNVPPDASIVFMKPGCPAEGMLWFDGDTGMVKRQRQVFDLLMTKTDVAASLIHEALYKTLRSAIEAGHDSTFTRAIVGRLFAVVPPRPRRPALPAAGPLYRCTSELADFDLFPSGRPAPFDPKAELWTLAWRKLLRHEFSGTAVSDGTRLDDGENSSFSAGGVVQLEDFRPKRDYFPGFANLSGSAWTLARAFARDLPEEATLPFDLESALTDDKVKDHPVHCRRLR